MKYSNQGSIKNKDRTKPKINLRVVLTSIFGALLIVKIINLQIHIDNLSIFINFKPINRLSLKEREKIEKVKKENPPVVNKPKIVVFNPSVEITNWKDGSIVYGEKVYGAITAGFDISFLNIGNSEARDVVIKWDITDNGRPITGLNKKIESLKPNELVTIKYGPHISAQGYGVLTLLASYSYVAPVVGERYAEQFKGQVEYTTEKDNQGKLYNFSPLK